MYVFYYVHESSACIYVLYVYRMNSCYSWRSEVSIRFLGTGVTEVSEPLCKCRESNHRPLQEQGPLAPALSLQTLSFSSARVIELHKECLPVVSLAFNS